MGGVRLVRILLFKVVGYLFWGCVLIRTPIFGNSHQAPELAAQGQRRLAGRAVTGLPASQGLEDNIGALIIRIEFLWGLNS